MRVYHFKGRGGRKPPTGATKEPRTGAVVLLGKMSRQSARLRLERGTAKITLAPINLKDEQSDDER